MFSGEAVPSRTKNNKILVLIFFTQTHVTVLNIKKCFSKLSIKIKKKKPKQPKRKNKKKNHRGKGLGGHKGSSLSSTPAIKMQNLQPPASKNIILQLRHHQDSQVAVYINPKL